MLKKLFLNSCQCTLNLPLQKKLQLIPKFFFEKKKPEKKNFGRYPYMVIWLPITFVKLKRTENPNILKVFVVRYYTTIISSENLTLAFK